MVADGGRTCGFEALYSKSAKSNFINLEFPIVRCSLRNQSKRLFPLTQYNGRGDWLESIGPIIAKVRRISQSGGEHKVTLA